MTSKLWTVARKELKELSRERVVLFGLLLGPLLMYLIMGAAAGAAGQQAKEAAVTPVRIAIVYQGPGRPPPLLESMAKALNATIVGAASPENLLRQGYDTVLVVHEGFEEKISTGQVAGVTLIYKPHSIGFIELNKPMAVEQAVEEAARAAVAEKLRQVLPNVSAEFLYNPVNVEVKYYYRGELTGYQQILGLTLGVGLAVPLAVLMTAIASAQVAAISFGVEKEAKTLEKLFTLPVRRRDLLLGKLTAVTALALGGVASYTAGFIIYMYMTSKAFATQTGQEATQAFTITIPHSLYGVIAAGLALAIYTTTVIGFIIGSQAQDVRGSQMAVNYTIFILLIPLFPLFFGLDPTTLPRTVAIALAVDPYWLLGIATYTAALGRTLTAALALTALAAHAITWTIIASHLLNPETMIIGHPLLKKLTRKLTKRKTP
ncbi:MAG: ABC transporter permease [Desulfurococcales archaeon]|nr:ABC transporter permease [Desulfurococcales archaeon]